MYFSKRELINRIEALMRAYKPYFIPSYPSLAMSQWRRIGILLEELKKCIQLEIDQRDHSFILQTSQLIKQISEETKKLDWCLI